MHINLFLGGIKWILEFLVPYYVWKGMFSVFKSYGKLSFWYEELVKLADNKLWNKFLAESE